MALSAVPARSGERQPTQQELIACRETMVLALQAVRIYAEIEASKEPKNHADLVQGGQAAIWAQERIAAQANAAVALAKVKAFATNPPTIPRQGGRRCW